MLPQATSNKTLFEHLFSNLFENQIIYHERVTMLCKVVQYDVTEEGFEIWLTPIKPLMELKSFREVFYNRLVEKGVFTLSSTFKFGDDDSQLYNGKSIGRPYCPFTLWPDKDLVAAVAQMDEAELGPYLNKMLWE
jgi:hypothetical protein